MHRSTCIEALVDFVEQAGGSVRCEHLGKLYGDDPDFKKVIQQCGGAKKFCDGSLQLQFVSNSGAGEIRKKSGAGEIRSSVVEAEHSVDAELMEMVQRAVDEVGHGPESDPAQVGGTFKEVYGISFKGYIKEHKLPSSHKLPRYIEALAALRQGGGKSGSNGDGPARPKGSSKIMTASPCLGKQGSSAKYTVGLPWTDVADIPTAVTEAVREIACQDNPENQVQVNYRQRCSRQLPFTPPLSSGISLSQLNLDRVSSAKLHQRLSPR